MVHYIGVLGPEYYETDVEVIPITFPFAGSHIWWPINSTDTLKLDFDFKSSTPLAVLAWGGTIIKEQIGYWEVRTFDSIHVNVIQHLPLFLKKLRSVNDEIRFQLTPDLNENNTVSAVVKFPPYNTSWHAIELNYTKGELSIVVDYKHILNKTFAMNFTLDNKVIIGSGKSQSGKWRQ